MDGNAHIHEWRPVVLWRHKAIACTCWTHSLDKIEVRLVSSGVTVQRQFFTDAESASEYAIEKMHAYNSY